MRSNCTCPSLAPPEIDLERIAIIGYSRGGTVALLAGIRDPRIDLVLDVVGPVDHLAAMDKKVDQNGGSRGSAGRKAMDLRR